MTRNVRWIAAGIALTWAGSAAAEIPYVGYLQGALNTLDPTAPTVNQGYLCAPCHNANGGTIGNPNLRPFGELLHQDGIGEPSSSEAQFEAVLREIQQQDPAVYKDLELGKDPNLDVSANSATVLPTPEFGCGSQLAPGRAVPRHIWIAGLVCAVVLWRRRGRRAHPGSLMRRPACR
jgi:hypothetical protein